MVLEQSTPDKPEHKESVGHGSVEDSARRMQWIYPQLLRDLSDVICCKVTAKVIFERSWQFGLVSEDWKKENITPIFKKGKKEDLSSFTLIPGKVIGQIFLEVISK